MTSNKLIKSVGISVLVGMLLMSTTLVGLTAAQSQSQEGNNTESRWDDFTVDKEIHDVQFMVNHHGGGNATVYARNTAPTSRNLNIQEFSSQSDFSLDEYSLEANSQTVYRVDDGSYAIALMVEHPIEGWDGKYVYNPVLGVLDVPPSQWLHNVILGIGVFVLGWTLSIVYYYKRILYRRVYAWRSVYDMDLWKYK